MLYFFSLLTSHANFIHVYSNESLTIERVYLFLYSFFKIIRLRYQSINRRIRRNALHALRRKCTIYPCVQAISMHASRPTYVRVTGARKKGVGYATAVSPQGVRVLLDSTNPRTLAPHNPRSTPLFHAPSLSLFPSFHPLLQNPTSLCLPSFATRLLRMDFSYHFFFFPPFFCPSLFPSFPLVDFLVSFLDWNLRLLIFSSLDIIAKINIYGYINFIFYIFFS